MAKRLSKESREVLADSAWWEELSKHLPWKLRGFTYRESAHFSTHEPYAPPLELRGWERDQILEAIRKGGQHAK